MLPSEQQMNDKILSNNHNSSSVKTNNFKTKILYRKYTCCGHTGWGTVFLPQWSSLVWSSPRPAASRWPSGPCPWSAFDLSAQAGIIWTHWKGRAEFWVSCCHLESVDHLEIVSGGAAEVDPPWLPVWLHPGGSVDCVTKQTVARHLNRNLNIYCEDLDMVNFF